MKILQIFGAVVAVHLFAFIFIFASPGCQSSPRNIPTPDATAPTAGAADASAGTGVSYNPAPVDTGAVAYAPPAIAGRAEPTRPGSPNAAALVPVKPADEVAPVSTYTVGRGDSLWSIAKKNHLTVAELAKANNLPVGATLQPGKKLIIPGKIVPKDLGTAPAPSEAKPASVPAAALARNGDAVKHTVQPGEALGTIARKYQVTVGELAAANSITDPAKVRAGQVLVIPGFKAVAQKSAATKPAAAKATSPNATTAAQAEPTVSTAPHFDLTPPPPGQDLDAGLKDQPTDVPTIKVEEPQTTPPPKG